MMKNLQQFAKVPPPGTKEKSCSVQRNDRYITIVTEEIWGSVYFSRRGLAIHAPRDMTPAWIGAHVRQALEASEYFCPPPGVPIDREQRIAMEAASTERFGAFWNEVASTYGYKSKELAWKKKDRISITWFYEVEPDIVMNATKSSRGGGWAAWPFSMDEGRVFRVPFAASDEEIGTTVLQTLAKCEGPGKSTQPLFP